MLILRQAKRNRSKTEISVTILTAAKDKPMSKTHIQYRAYLSNVTAGEYISELLSKGLLVQNGKSYRTMSQGLEYFKLYQQMQRL